MCTSATAQSKHFERTSSSERVGNYTKESKCKRRIKPPRWKWEKTIQYNDVTLPHFKEPDEWVGEKGQVSLLKSLLLLSAPWSVQRDSSLSSSFLWDQVWQNNFAWKMQGWLHPGGSGSSLSTFCVWETSLCAGHTRLAVLLSVSWVLAMTVTIFLNFFPKRKLRVRKTRILWALWQNQLSAWTVWYQAWEDLLLERRMLFSSFTENPQRQCWMTWAKGPGSFFQRRTLCFKSGAFGVKVGGGRRGGWILLPLSKLAKSTSKRWNFTLKFTS